MLFKLGTEMKISTTEFLSEAQHEFVEETVFQIQRRES